MPGEKPQPRPDRFFDHIWGYQQTAALKAALELDLFTAVGEGAGSVAALAKKIKASERGTRILCDYLVVAGFLAKQDGAYRLTPDSATFLDRRSPAFIGSAATFLTADHIRRAFDNVTDAVRKGGKAIEDDALEPEHPIWVEFARAMAPVQGMMAGMVAQVVQAPTTARQAGTNGPCKVLDIAAGHGLFGITLAKQNPKTTVTAVDWANVLALAEASAREAGVAERWTALPGSAFEVDFGNGYDLALVTNFLHHFEAATCEKFLRRVHAALKPGGRAVTLEFVPNEDRVSPPRPAQFSLAMLAVTSGGDAYTFAELERMHRNAGFARCEHHRLPTDHSVVIAHK